MGKDAGQEEGFGSFLAEAMRRTRMSAADLGRASGLNATQISNWQRDMSQPSIENLRKLVRPLRTPLLTLMVEAGHVSKDEAQLRDVRSLPVPEPVTTRDAILGDDQLDDTARVLLLASYDAATDAPARLRAVARKPRTTPPPERR